MEMEKVKPKVSYYHYSNENSQGALICETKKFPKTTLGYQYHSGYSDRLREWDGENYKKVCKLIGGGSQVWAYELPKHNDKKLKEIAKLAFELESLPKHVRFIHYFNVSNGYSCPVIVALTKE